jgi:hypothetical protein
MDDLLTLESPEQIAAATHPSRAAILAAMRTPATAAAAGRATGMSRQNAAYHVRELVKTGLLRRTGERQNGAFREQLYEARARSFVISPRTTWGEERARAVADQASLGRLIELGERLRRDATVLLDRAAFDGADVPSASAQAEVRFPTAAARAAFLRDCVDAVARLAAEHGGHDGDPYRVVVATYPEPVAEAGREPT